MPERWDPTTNPVVKFYIWLANNEDVGDKFKLQLSYNKCKCTVDKIIDTSFDLYYNGIVTTDHNTQYSTYEATFELDKDKLDNDDMLSCRLYRIATDAPQISNEVVIYKVAIEFERDKMGGTF